VDNWRRHSEVSSAGRLLEGRFQNPLEHAAFRNRRNTEMFKKTILPATLAVAMLAGFGPAYATMSLPHNTPPAPSEPAKTLDKTALQQMATEAGITVEQASHLTIGQLAALKEARDS